MGVLPGGRGSHKTTMEREHRTIPLRKSKTKMGFQCINVLYTGKKSMLIRNPVFVVWEIFFPRFAIYGRLGYPVNL